MDICYYIANKLIKLYDDKIILIEKNYTYNNKFCNSVYLVSLSPFKKSYAINNKLFEDVLISENNNLDDIIIYNSDDKLYKSLKITIIKDCFQINIESLLNAPEAKTSSLQNRIKYNFYNEYPTICPKCNKQTCFGKALINKDQGMMLGYSMCTDCLIRYSVSEKDWICCSAVKSGLSNYTTICGKKISNNNYQCSEKHYKNKIAITKTNTFVPPYLDECYIVYNNINENDI